MTPNKVLENRAAGCCELCKSEAVLQLFILPDSPQTGLESQLMLCNICTQEAAKVQPENLDHLRCLNESIWSEIPAIQVLSWRLLHRIKEAGWPRDLLDMMYMDQDTLAWAEVSGDHLEVSEAVVHKDVNGVVLAAGDTVVLIKDLKVKGSSMVAKQGTAVRRISLDPDNPKYIEGKVDGQHIVILTDYVKKS